MSNPGRFTSSQAAKMWEFIETLANEESEDPDQERYDDLYFGAKEEAQALVKIINAQKNLNVSRPTSLNVPTKLTILQVWRLWDFAANIAHDYYEGEDGMNDFDWSMWGSDVEDEAIYLIRCIIEGKIK